MSRDPEKALQIAADILYFDDDSDYGTALWEIIEALGGREAVEKSESLCKETKEFILNELTGD